MEDKSVSQNQPMHKHKSKYLGGKTQDMYMKELKALERKKEKFNGFYYLFVKPKILVPRTTRPLNPKLHILQ